MSEPSTRVVIVEGESDRIALETLAARTGRDLAATRTSIVPIGGAHAIRRFLKRLAHDDPAVWVAGLCDMAQEGYYMRAVEEAGLGQDLTREAMARLGFFVCVVDLEDELIRALGTAGVESVIEAEGELRPFRSFQKQAPHAGTPIATQQRYFMNTHSGRKAQYARALVNALDRDRIPEPLHRVLNTPGTPLRAALSR